MLLSIYELSTVKYVSSEQPHESKVPYPLVDNEVSSGRRPGRPREFDPDEALDRAVEMFWADGFEGVDVDRIARAVGVTKPSLYRLFGDKSSLFVHALRRYGDTVGAGPLAAFDAQPDIGDAVRALLEASVKAGTADGGPRGCLLACVAVVQAERSPAVGEAITRGQSALADILERRFEQAATEGVLPARPPPRARSRLLVDLMQGLLMRARAGASRDTLLEDAREYVPLVLG